MLYFIAISWGASTFSFGYSLPSDLALRSACSAAVACRFWIQLLNTTAVICWRNDNTLIITWKRNLFRLPFPICQSIRVQTNLREIPGILPYQLRTVRSRTLGALQKPWWIYFKWHYFSKPYLKRLYSLPWPFWKHNTAKSVSLELADLETGSLT